MPLAIKHCPPDCSCRWLTELDRRILRYLAKGHSNGEVARFVKHSESYVKKRLQHIGQRLGVASRLEIVLRAQALGLLPIPAAARGPAMGDPRLDRDPS